MTCYILFLDMMLVELLRMRIYAYLHLKQHPIVSGVHRYINKESDHALQVVPQLLTVQRLSVC